MGDTLFTLEALATLAGAAFLTFMIVGYTKTYIQKWFKLPTDIYAVLVGSGVLLAAQLGAGADPKNWTLYFLSIANGFLVALQAGKMNDKAVVEAEKAKAGGPSA